MIVAHFVAAAVALAVTLRLYAGLPDRDRRRAYPHRPGAWLGMTGARVGLGPILRSRFFFGLTVTLYGSIAGTWLTFAPARMAAFGGVVVALLLASRFAGRMLVLGPGALSQQRLPPRTPPAADRPRVLFIGGSSNQTTQMHQIAEQLDEADVWFTPYYGDNPFYRTALRWGLLETAIIGYNRRGVCLDYLNEHGLQVDLQAERNLYDLVVTCNDQVMPANLRHARQVLVQEGIQDPPNWKFRLWRRTKLIPRPLVGTSNFGLSDLFDALCVASDGYRRHFERLGVQPDKIEVTGIPNFDNFARFRENGFPHRDYVLACTTDARETGAESRRAAFLQEVVRSAGGRLLIFKLHPNENFERATAEIRAVAPTAVIYTEGRAEEMVANCAVLFTEWSSLTFCGLALGKDVRSHHPAQQTRALLPLQHGRAAANIAEVCRRQLRSVR